MHGSGWHHAVRIVADLRSSAAHSLTSCHRDSNQACTQVHLRGICTALQADKRGPQQLLRKCAALAASRGITLWNSARCAFGCQAWSLLWAGVQSAPLLEMSAIAWAQCIHCPVSFEEFVHSCTQQWRRRMFDLPGHQVLVHVQTTHVDCGHVLDTACTAAARKLGAPVHTPRVLARVTWLQGTLEQHRLACPLEEAVCDGRCVAVLQPHGSCRRVETLPRRHLLTSLIAGRARSRQVSSALHDDVAAMTHSTCRLQSYSARLYCRHHCQRVRVACRAERKAANKTDATSVAAAGEPAADALAAQKDIPDTDCTRVFAWPNGRLRGVLPAEASTCIGSLAAKRCLVRARRRYTDGLEEGRFAGKFLAKAKRAQPGLCMVDHILARCKWAARLGADDIAEARGVERALHGADVRLQAHHVYDVARKRSKRHSSQPTTGA